MTRKKTSPLTSKEEKAIAKLPEVQKQEIRDARLRALGKLPVTVETVEVQPAPERPDPPFDWETHHQRTFRIKR